MPLEYWVIIINAVNNAIINAIINAVINLFMSAYIKMSSGRIDMKMFFIRKDTRPKSNTIPPTKMNRTQMPMLMTTPANNYRSMSNIIHAPAGGCSTCGH